MKKIIISLFFILIMARTAGAQPHTGSLGLGVVIGEPFGPTLKYWTNSNQAFQMGIGFGDDLILYGDYLWHAWNLAKGPSRNGIGGYLGVGPRFEDEDHGDDKFGFRFVGGLDYFMESQPIELFIELVPVFQVSPDTDTDLDAGVGLRVYFGGM